MGFIVLQFQPSKQASSIVLAGFQSNNFFAFSMVFLNGFVKTHIFQKISLQEPSWTDLRPVLCQLGPQHGSQMAPKMDSKTIKKHVLATFPIPPKKHSKNILAPSKNIEKHSNKNSPECFLSVFEAFLSSRMGRGVPAPAGGSGGNPFSIPKRFNNIQKTFQGVSFECFSTFFKGAGVFFECFLGVLDKLPKHVF